MGMLAWRVSADEQLRVGTEADRIYLVDGFYDAEQSAEHGIYRWTQPLAQLVLPNWGPGRIHVKVEGVAGAGGEIALKMERGDAGAGKCNIRARMEAGGLGERGGR